MCGNIFVYLSKHSSLWDYPLAFILEGVMLFFSALWLGHIFSIRHDEVVDMEPGLWWGPSQDGDWRGGRVMFAGFVVFGHKTTRFLGWSTKPSPETRRWRDYAGSVWPVDLTGLTGGSRVRREASMWKARGMISWLASRLSKVWWKRVRPMENSYTFWICPPWACTLSLCCRCSLGIRPPPIYVCWRGGWQPTLWLDLEP
jgi:hypothetical protein